MTPRQRRATYCLSALVAALVATSSGASAGSDKGKDKPLQLESYKSFVVGGQRVTRADGTVGLTGHLYVEAFIPYQPDKSKRRPPIVMTHTSISGTIFLQRSNGEEGWATMFARAGYPVYVVDPAGTGRASVDLTQYDRANISQSDSDDWAGWKHGPAFAQLGFNPPDAPFDATPHRFPMNQMPTDEKGVNNWLGHRMVYALNPGDEVKNAAFFKLLEQIGEPVIWMGWSAGGERGQQLVVERPELFRALAHIEGCRPGPSIPPFIDTVVAHKIPMLHVNPDYGRIAPSQSYLPSGSRCVSPLDVAAEIRSRGGKAVTVFLPDVGIYGNGHEYMLQNNADKIVEKVYLPWLDKYANYKRDDHHNKPDKKDKKNKKDKHDKDHGKHGRH